MASSDNHLSRFPSQDSVHGFGRAPAEWGARQNRLNLSLTTTPEQKPADHSALYRGVIEQSQPIYITDFAGNLILTNKAFAEISGPLFDVADISEGIVDTPPALMKVIERIYLDQRPIEKKETVTVDGKSLSYIARHFPIHDENSEIIGFAGTYTDISRQNQAILRAGEVETWLQDVIRSASDWVWETDANFNLRFVSPRISEALGIPPQVLKGKHLFDLGRFESDPKMGRDVRELMDRHAPFRHYLFLMPDDHGKERRIHLSGVPVFAEDNGRFVGYRGTGTDMTRQHEAEKSAFRAKVELEKTLDALKQRNLQLDLALKKAQVADKAKMNFLAMMSHELRTPLNAVIGFSEVGAGKVLGPLSDTYQNYFNDILKAGQHLLTIISDILDTANIENQEISVETKPVRAKELINEARSLVALRAEEKKLDMDQVEIEDRWTLLVDRVRARQIFVNLFSNAIKFSPEGGKIGVDIAEASDNKLALTVWDSGFGIPADQQERVFEQFFQGEDDILSRREEGTGLGLSVSRYLAHLMNGDITLESKVGEGSRFTLILPMANPVVPVSTGD